jgi:hypothetical protein
MKSKKIALITSILLILVGCDNNTSSNRSYPDNSVSYPSTTNPSYEIIDPVYPEIGTRFDDISGYSGLEYRDHVAILSYEGNKATAISDIPSFINNLPVTVIGPRLFEGVTSATGFINIPSTVQEIQTGAFAKTTGLIDFNTGTHPHITPELSIIGDYAFANNTVTIPGTTNDVLLPATVTSIGAYAFYQSDIKTINIPTGSRLNSIGNYAFSKTAITTFSVPETVKSIGPEAFFDARNLEEIKVAATNTNYASNSHGDLFDKTLQILIQAAPAATRTAPAKAGGDGDRKLANCQTQGRDNVFEFPSYTVIQVEENALAFNQASCYVLRFNDEITKEENESISDQKSRYFIYNDTGTTIKDGLYFNSSNEAAQQDRLLVAIPTSSISTYKIDKEVEFITSSAFANLTSLQTITVDEQNTSYKSIDGILYSKDGTTLVAVPRNYQTSAITVPATTKKINKFAFYGLNNPITLTIQGTIESIGAHAFEDSTINFTSPLLEQNTPIDTIEKYAFNNTNASNLVISTINAVTIQEGAFANFTFPNGVINVNGTVSGTQRLVIGRAAFFNSNGGATINITSASYIDPNYDLGAGITFVSSL